MRSPCLSGHSDPRHAGRVTRAEAGSANAHQTREPPPDLTVQCGGFSAREILKEMKAISVLRQPRHAAACRRVLAPIALAVLCALGVPALRAVSERSALTGDKQSYAYSWQQEVQQGAEADKEIMQQMGLYDNPQLQAYVQSVGQRVLSVSAFTDANTPEMYRNTKFTFRVLDSPVVNAFALPGGYVYVTRGLLAHVDNEAQLAVVLGHEITHVAARHASQQARRNQWGQLGVIAGAVLGQAVLGDRAPNVADTVMNTGGQALQVFMLRYSREAEQEADTYGVEYALRAGYAAGDSARFFDALGRLSAEEGSSIPTWLSSHPDPGDRAGRVVQLASEKRQATGQPMTLGYDEYMRAIDGIVLGEDPRQGFTQNGVFYHPTLHFQMPVAAGWKVDNQPAAVVMAEPNGRAVMALKVASGNRTHDAATQFVSENKVQVTASGDTAVNGLPATVIVGRATTDKGEVGVWDAFVELGGKVYSMLGYSSPQNFEQMRPTFESVAGGFSPLRDARVSNVQPVKLRVVRADQPAPFASFIPTSLPPKMTPESIAIMNQVSLNEKVPAGAPIKVPDASAFLASSPFAGDTGAVAAQPAPAPQTETYPAPAQTGYPPANYPQQQPAYPSQYPQPAPTSPYPSTYPPQTTYPPAAPSWPSSTGSTTTQPYPPQGYPQPSYPPQQPPQPQVTPQPQYPYPPPAGSPQYPQYPQTSTPTTTPTTTANPAPTWPR